MARSLHIFAPAPDEQTTILDAGTRLGGTAKLVAYYTPTGTIAAITTAVFVSFRLLFGAEHVAAHWWGLGIGGLIALAVTARGCHQIQRWAADMPGEPTLRSR